jgi:hypothetical protein
MESNPEEFYGDASKWGFMFAPNFRDVMTEPEKGALHEALKGVRRKEFDELVVRRMLRDSEEETMKQVRSSSPMTRKQVTTAIGSSLNDAFGAAQLGNYQQQQAMQQNHIGQHIAGQGLLSKDYNPALNDPNRNPYK